MKAIFTLLPWHGCASESARLKAGALVIHDALYWIPLIASYSLARREEICGLMITDVVFDEAIPHFDIRPNRYRRLKNPQSKRKIPIHPELLRLGLHDYVLAIGALG
jgi:integrase